MKAHLSDEELAEWLRGCAVEAESHLRECADCRAEAEALRAAIRVGRQWVGTRAERNQVFWMRQQRLIRERIEHRPPGFLPRGLVLATAAVVLCVMLFLTRSPRPTVPAGNDDADNVLLQQVESEVAQDYPSALAPAVLLSQERSAALSAGTAPNLNRTNR
jgi:hypothetical protein